MAVKKKACTVGGRGEKSRLSDPGSELPLGKIIEESAKIIEEISKKQENYFAS